MSRKTWKTTTAIAEIRSTEMNSMTSLLDDLASQESPIIIDPVRGASGCLTDRLPELFAPAEGWIVSSGWPTSPGMWLHQEIDRRDNSPFYTSDELRDLAERANNLLDGARPRVTSLVSDVPVQTQIVFIESVEVPTQLVLVRIRERWNSSPDAPVHVAIYNVYDMAAGIETVGTHIANVQGGGS
jgi:hypothetical protein